MLLIILLLVTACILLAIAVVSYVSRRKRPENHYLRKLAGPPPNLIFGNTLELIGSTTKFLSIFLRWEEKYGPIWRGFDGPFSSMVVVSDEKFMEYIFNSPKLINKSPQYDYFHNWLGSGLLTSTALKHRTRRKLLTPAFHFSILENFVAIFDSASDVFVKKLDGLVGEPNLDIYPLVSLCNLDIICETAMGTKINAQFNENSKYVRSVKTMCSIVIDRTFSALSPTLYPLTINYLREKIALRTLHSHSDTIIDKRIRGFEDAEGQEVENDVGVRRKLAFLDLLIKASDNGVRLSRQDIREEVDTFMFEGHDTTSSALSFCLYSLATNPLIQEKAMEEQRQIFNGRDMKTAPTTMADLQNMKYLELVIKETLRLYPSVPFFGRISTEEIEYDGVYYPKNTIFGIFPMASHRNPKFFPNPEEFKPERFLEADGKNPYVYVPFSAGPRNCIGQKFAMLQLKSTVSKVLRHFELLPAQPQHKLQLAPEIILISKNGIRLSLKRRSYE